MIFADKLQTIRRSQGFTQEQLAERLKVSRQAVTRWEAGQAYPDIDNLIALSRLFHISIDYLVKDEDCQRSPALRREDAWEPVIRFRMEAGRRTYAGDGPQAAASRPCSHDYRYEKGAYLYIDTYVGGECFSGEEAIWKAGIPVWTMNYAGRTLKDTFSGDFLKQALRNCNETHPYRGPASYQAGEYAYKMQAAGDMAWFQGYEEIFFQNDKVYECYFHGGRVR